MYSISETAFYTWKNISYQEDFKKTTIQQSRYNLNTTTVEGVNLGKSGAAIPTIIAPKQNLLYLT